MIIIIEVYAFEIITAHNNTLVIKCIKLFSYWRLVFNDFTQVFRTGMLTVNYYGQDTDKLTWVLLEMAKFRHFCSTLKIKNNIIKDKNI